MNLEEAVRELGGLLEPTGDEKKNGWSPETLTLYHAERQKSSFDRIMNPPPVKPSKTNNSMKWSYRAE